MLFSSKPLLYLQLLDQSLRYMALDPKDKSVIEKNEIVFDTKIVQDGKITNLSLLETRLDALVKEKKWKNAKTHILLLNDFVTVREETVPVQLTPSEVTEYLSLHINQSIRLPFENPKVDFEIVDKTETEQKIIMIAYPGEYVRQYQDILQNVSLKPVVADIASLCFYRAANKQALFEKSLDDHILILEWNPYDTAIMVFNQNLPKFNRHSRSSRNGENWKIDKKGDWSWQSSQDELDDMLEEQLNGLERFMDFYRYSVLDGDGSVTEIILTGYYPDLGDLKRRLSERFSAKIRLLDLPDKLGQPYGALYGLSLKDSNIKLKKTDRRQSKLKIRDTADQKPKGKEELND